MDRRLVRQASPASVNDHAVNPTCKLLNVEQPDVDALVKIHLIWLPSVQRPCGQKLIDGHSQALVLREYSASGVTVQVVVVLWWRETRVSKAPAGDACDLRHTTSSQTGCPAADELGVCQLRVSAAWWQGYVTV